MHLAKISRTMLADSGCPDFAAALEMGSTILEMAVPIPGFFLVIKSLQCIYVVAANSTACDEESARLMAYTASMTASFSQFAKRIEPSPAVTKVLDEASDRLDILRTLIDTFDAQHAIARMFSGAQYKAAAEQAERDVDRAIRAVIDLAQLQGIADIADVKSKVELLLSRRCSPNPPPQQEKEGENRL
jgi:hypothetical protein